MEGLLSLQLFLSRYDNILQWSGRRLISYEYSEDFGEGPCGVLSYNTDYILVKREDYLRGAEILKSAGYEITD